MQITGKVTDSSSEPLIGANVFISDASGSVLNPPKGAVVDVNGNYKLQASLGDFITASYVGMEKATTKITSSVKIKDFVLSLSKLATLNTVEITAKGGKPKKNIGLILFVSLAGILIIAGATLSMKESK